MKCADQYPATKFTVAALRILVEHPGLRASEFAEIRWPHLRKAGLLAALKLHWLVQKKLVRSRFEPPFWKPGNIKPRKKYYVTDEGFAVHEFHSRKQRAEENRHSPHADGTG